MKINLNAPPHKQYLYGFVWGTERISDGYTIMYETRLTDGPYWPEIYGTQKSVIEAATKHTNRDGWRTFYRGYMLEGPPTKYDGSIYPEWKEKYNERVYLP